MERLKKQLKAYKSGKISLSEIIQELRDLPFENLEFAHIDHHRPIRTGFPEVIFCEGKTVLQIKKITRSILDSGAPLLGTRAEEKIYKAIKNDFPELHYNRLARTIFTKPQQMHSQLDDKLVIISAGTSDLAVAEEAYETSFVMGFKAKKIYDVGVAGLHRLLNYRKPIEQARVIIVVAGMEGALPSVVGGLVSVPLIAVPTSTGYGASFNGFAALLAMLNSCASGVTVVNIDNGFGAAFAACQILKLLL
jgi:NCAIR mutase (PurE)-related protein